MQILQENIAYGKVLPPQMQGADPVELTAETMSERKQKVLDAMEKAGFDSLVIYADREHGANFGYLTGFEPRFEEACIVLHKNGKAFLLLGNESLRMNQYSLLKATAIHVPYFSLPNQPMDGEEALEKVFEKAGIISGRKIGAAGWKLFSSSIQSNEKMFDLPHFIVRAIEKAVGTNGELLNATNLFIDPENGVRIRMNANEIAHFEFGATLASNCIFDVLEAIEPGKTELELAQNLSAYGQPTTVQTICATGERFTNAVVAPRLKKVALGDKFAATIGFRGGLTNRCAYVADKETDLPPNVNDYLKKAAVPYFSALATWYSSIRVGLKASELYGLIETVIPKETYGWKLNPGHFVASEEWMSSPATPNSNTVLGSGMMLQADIILSISGYGGCNGEDGIALADERLCQELAGKYPQTWERMQARRKYMQEVLQIPLDGSVLPMSDLCGYVRPFLLNKGSAFSVTWRR